MRGRCTSEFQQQCPLYQSNREGYTDVHHLAYERHDYRSGISKRFRELEQNKIQIARCLHDAIHASGYTPEKPQRDEMLAAIWQGDTEWSRRQWAIQLAIGRAVLGGSWDGDVA